MGHYLTPSLSSSSARRRKKLSRQISKELSRELMNPIASGSQRKTRRSQNYESTKSQTHHGSTWFSGTERQGLYLPSPSPISPSSQSTLSSLPSASSSLSLPLHSPPGNNNNRKSLSAVIGDSPRQQRRREVDGSIDELSISLATMTTEWKEEYKKNSKQSVTSSEEEEEDNPIEEGKSSKSRGMPSFGGSGRKLVKQISKSRSLAAQHLRNSTSQ